MQQYVLQYVQVAVGPEWPSFLVFLWSDQIYPCSLRIYFFRSGERIKKYLDTCGRVLKLPTFCRAPRPSLRSISSSLAVFFQVVFSLPCTISSPVVTAMRQCIFFWFIQVSSELSN